MTTTINASTSAGLINTADTSGVLQLQTAGTAALTIDTSANVGIGTSSPDERLTVTSTNPTNGFIASLRNNGTSGLTGSKLWFNQNTVDNWNIGQPAGVNAFVFCNSTGSTNERMRIDSSGNVLVTNPAGLGYGTGSGGTVTQATSKSTAVTLNKPTGQITMNNAALAASTAVTFTFNNNLITSSADNIIVTIAGSGTAGAYVLAVTNVSSSGSCNITLRNLTGGSLSEGVIFNFAIIKGATS